jgi:hypothetical protein
MHQPNICSTNENELRGLGPFQVYGVASFQPIHFVGMCMDMIFDGLCHF